MAYQGAPPQPDQNFLDFMQFLEEIWQNRMLAPTSLDGSALGPSRGQKCFFVYYPRIIKEDEGYLPLSLLLFTRYCSVVRGFIHLTK